MSHIQIIGISGTNGSGKDTIGHLLSEQHNYFFISVTDILRAELTKQGKTTERENMRELSAQWRRQHGLAVLIDRAMDLYRQQPDEYQGVVMASLRNPYEADRIHELGGTVIWVDADAHVRYERLQSNNRGRIDDDKTFEQFMTEEQAEMHPSGDSATLDMAAVRDRADATVINDSSSVIELEQNLTNTLDFLG